MMNIHSHANLVEYAFRREFQILLGWVRPCQIKSSIHFWCVQSPVWYTDKANVSIFNFKQTVKYFEWIVLGEFCKTDFIEHEHWKQIILFSVRVIFCLLIRFFNTLGGARVRALERHHNKLLDCFKVSVNRFWTLEVSKDKSDSQRFTAAWLTTNENWNLVNDARDYCKYVFFESLINRNIRRELHPTYVIILFQF